MILVNGKPNSQTSALDRGLLYGQSVFETIAIANSKPCLLDLHLNRLEKGCSVLGIPFNGAELTAELSTAIESLSEIEKSKAVIRVTITMGQGGRGYKNPEKTLATRIISAHPYPSHAASNWLDGIKMGVADIRLAHQPAFAGLKHGNRLEQTIARSQWQDDWQEALLLDQQKQVIEGTQSNVFIVKDSCVFTPSLKSAGVAGVAREYILSQLHSLGLSFETVSLSLNDIKAADEVFLSNSVIGVWPVKQLNERTYFSFVTSHKLLKLMIKNEVIPNYKA